MILRNAPPLYGEMSQLILLARGNPRLLQRQCCPLSV